jgi:hypothetical protein
MNANDLEFAATLPTQEVSLDVLREKYARGDETTAAVVWEKGPVHHDSEVATIAFMLQRMPIRRQMPRMHKK